MSGKLPKVLLAGLNYLPEPTGIAPYTAKMAAALSKRGYGLKVLTGYPHYPEWKIREGYTGLTMKDSVLGTSITRLRHPVPSSNGTVARTLMEALFGLHTAVSEWHKPDVVISVSPALFATAATGLKAKAFRIPFGVWVQDIYTRGLEETTGKSSPMTRAMRFVEGSVLRQATGVAVIHERFKSYVVDELKVPADRVTVIRNWTHVPSEVEFDRAETRASLGWAEDAFIVLHAGNMGVKQGLDHVVESAKHAGATGAHIVLMGNGSQRSALEEQAAGVPSVSIIDSLSDDDYPKALRAADALLVNELPQLREMSVPSKLTSYFSTGVPVIASTDPASSTADEIRASGAGILVDPSDPTAIVSAAQILRDSPEDARTMGQAGKTYVQNVLAESTAVSGFESWIGLLVSSKTQSPDAPR